MATEPGFYNMDCMEGMKEFPDGFFDLAIVDPVYGDVTKGGYMTHNKGQRIGTGAANSKGYHAGLWGQQKSGADYFQELRRVSQNQIIWGGELLRRYAAFFSGVYRVGQATSSRTVFRRLRNCVDFVLPGSENIPLHVGWDAPRRYEAQREANTSYTETRCPICVDSGKIRETWMEDSRYPRWQRVQPDSMS